MSMQEANEASIQFERTATRDREVTAYRAFLIDGDLRVIQLGRVAKYRCGPDLGSHRHYWTATAINGDAVHRPDGGYLYRGGFYSRAQAGESLRPD